MINIEELNFLNQFIMNRPLTTCNLYDAATMLDILKKINSEVNASLNLKKEDLPIDNNNK